MHSRFGRSIVGLLSSAFLKSCLPVLWILIKCKFNLKEKSMVLLFRTWIRIRTRGFLAWWERMGIEEKIWSWERTRDFETVQKNCHSLLSHLSSCFIPSSPTHTLYNSLSYPILFRTPGTSYDVSVLLPYTVERWRAWWRGKTFLHIVFFLLGDPPGSKFYVPTFRNTFFHYDSWCIQETFFLLKSTMKMEQTECSETSAEKI